MDKKQAKVIVELASSGHEKEALALATKLGEPHGKPTTYVSLPGNILRFGNVENETLLVSLYENGAGIIEYMSDFGRVDPLKSTDVRKIGKYAEDLLRFTKKFRR